MRMSRSPRQSPARSTQVLAALLRWLDVETLGLDNVPKTVPALLIDNPASPRILDVIFLQAALRRRCSARRFVRPLFHIGLEKKLLFGHLVSQYMGGVIGHPRNARYLLDKGELILACPECAPTTGERFAEYDPLVPLEYLSHGWARFATETGVPVISVASTGFESTVPTLFRSRALRRFWLADDSLYPVTSQGLPAFTVPALAFSCCSRCGRVFMLANREDRPPATQLSRLCARFIAASSKNSTGWLGVAYVRKATTSSFFGCDAPDRQPSKWRIL